MFINKEILAKRVLESKSDVIVMKTKFDGALKHDSIAKGIEALIDMKNQTNDTIYKNIKYALSVPVLGPEFVSFFCESSNIQSEDIDSVIEQARNFNSVLVKNKYSNKEHLDSLNSMVCTLEALSAERRSSEYLKYDTIYNLAANRLRNQCGHQTYYTEGLDTIINNFHFDNNTVNLYESMLKRVKLCEDSNVVSEFPPLLFKNTKLVLTAKKSISKKEQETILGVPMMLADKIEEFSPMTPEGAAKMMWVQRKIILNKAEKGDVPNPDFCKLYADELDKAAKTLSKGKKTLKENIGAMQPDIIMYEESVVDDVSAELDDIIAAVVLNDEDESIPEETLESLGKIYLTLESLTENVIEEAGVTNKLAQGAHAVERGSHKAVGAVKTVAGDVKRVVEPIKRIPHPIDRAINNTLDKIKELDGKERRERIISGNFRKSLFKDVRRVITAGAIWAGAANPVIGILGIIAAFAVDKRNDIRARREVLNELEAELTIVNEKIEDSRGDENRQKKYELMRIKNKLEKDIERIKYRL